MSQRAYALKHGHPVCQMGYWVRRLSAAPRQVAALVPVVIKPTAAPSLVLRGPQGLSLELAAGTPGEWLANLLRSL